jgi:hypothetical protein
MVNLKLIMTYFIALFAGCTGESLQDKLENKSWKVIDQTLSSNYIAFSDSHVFICKDEEGWFDFGKYILSDNKMNLTVGAGRYFDSFDVSEININQSDSGTRLSYLAKPAGSPESAGEIKLFTLSESDFCVFGPDIVINKF